MKKILIIQTAFIGDVVLATALAEKLHSHFPNTSIHFLVRKGNEGLLQNNPTLDKVLIWNKKEHKLRNLFAMLKTIRANKYDRVINVQRFFATGLLFAFAAGLTDFPLAEPLLTFALDFAIFKNLAANVTKFFIVAIFWLFRPAKIEKQAIPKTYCGLNI